MTEHDHHTSYMLVYGVNTASWGGAVLVLRISVQWWRLAL